MSSKIRLKRSSTPGSAPNPVQLDYGEVTLNYADGVLYFRKPDDSLGSITTGGSASGISRVITTYEPASTTSTFQVSGGYTVGYLDVYRNGVRLLPTLDFTATNGTSVTLGSAALSGDVVELVAHRVYPLVTTVARNVNSFTATSNQTTFTPTGGYTPGYVDVYLNGVKLLETEDYVATNSTSVVLTSGCVAGDVVEIVAHTVHGLGDGYTKQEADARYEPLGSAVEMAIALGD